MSTDTGFALRRVLLATLAFTALAVPIVPEGQWWRLVLGYALFFAWLLSGWAALGPFNPPAPQAPAPCRSRTALTMGSRRQRGTPASRSDDTIHAQSSRPTAATALASVQGSERYSRQ